MDVTATIKLAASAVEKLTLGLASASVESPANASLAFTSGTGANAVNKVWSKSATAAISTPDVYTLSALVDDVGRTVVFTKIRTLIIINLDTVDGHALTVGNAATHPWAGAINPATATFTVKAGGFEVKAAPLATAFPVVAGSSDQLMVDPGLNTIAYKIFLIGE